jgi:hypothetical protein
MKRTPTVLSALSVAIIGAASCERSSKYVEPPASSYTVDRFTLATEVTDTLTGAMVSPEFFTAANVRPLLGRFFLQSEYETVVQPVVVISDELWRRRFSGAPQVIGERILLNGRAVTVIGVAPPLRVADWRRGVATSGSEVTDPPATSIRAGAADDRARRLHEVRQRLVADDPHPTTGSPSARARLRIAA